MRIFLNTLRCPDDGRDQKSTLLLESEWTQSIDLPNEGVNSEKCKTMITAHNTISKSHNSLNFMICS